MDRVTMLKRNVRPGVHLAAIEKHRAPGDESPEAPIYLVREHDRLPNRYDPIPMPEDLRRHLEAAGLFVPLV